MTKKYKSNHGRRYSDCAPAPFSSNPRQFSGGTIGPVVSGFDHYGYPIVQNFRLPAPYHLSEGRRFSSAASSTSIMPMKLSDANSDLKAGIAKVAKFRLKPSPTVPAAPRDLPSQFDFCIQSGSEGHFFRFRNARHPLHGAEANVIDCQPDAAGMMVCMVNMPGSGTLAPAPLCEESGADKEPVPVTCCVKSLGDESGQIVCPGSAYDLLLVKIVATDTVGGIRIASVQHLDLPGGGARLPVCEPIDEAPEERPCCIEEETGIIICPEGMNFPLAGKKIPIQYLEFVDHDGMKAARLRCGDISNIPDNEFSDPLLNSMKRVCEDLGGYIFPVCTKRERDRPKPSRIPTGRQRVPDICCYDPMTGTLICEGTEYHNLAVSVVAEAAIGSVRIVSVVHDQLPGGGIRVPLCPPKPEIPQLPPENCCVIESSTGMTLSCDPVNHPWNGRNVTGSGQCIETPNGRFCVLRWEDSNGSHTLEVPVCPPPLQKIPPPSADTPPPPDAVPYLPPPSVMPAECEGEEARRCRERWDEMVNRPAKFTKCDEKWLKIVEQFKTGCGGPGRRASSMGISPSSSLRRYGMGIDPENLQYGRFPGLRGGRRMI